jgi:hypothetical protein
MADNNELMRFNFVVTQELMDAIDQYRTDTGKLPSKAVAVRELIQLGLKKYYEDKNRG